jgi:glycosyltransferase involved in cell wall biosynthesis
MRRVRLELANRYLSEVNMIKLDALLGRDPEGSFFRSNTPQWANVLAKHSIFLVVANPGDLRKNLPALIDGFSLAAQENPKVSLLIKLVIDNRSTTLGTVTSDLLPRQYRNIERTMGDIAPTNIYVMSDFLSKDQLYVLYLCVDFYLAPSVAEGQNLPLQEAMAMGTIPVAAPHTAMADYITTDNGVAIDWKWAPAPRCFERAYGLRDFRLPEIAPEDITRAVLSAAELDDRQRDRKRAAAWKMIESLYSEKVLGPRMRELFECYLG